jgi:hypothetical protein
MRALRHLLINCPVRVMHLMVSGGLKLLRPDRRKLATAIKDNVQDANYKAA